MDGRGDFEVGERQIPMYIDVTRTKFCHYRFQSVQELILCMSKTYVLSLDSSAANRRSYIYNERVIRGQILLQ
jgi:hypothetical protein